MKIIVNMGVRVMQTGRHFDRSGWEQKRVKKEKKCTGYVPWI